MQKKILLILTGGTICSFKNRFGEQAADTERAQALIVENFRAGDSAYRDEQSVLFKAVRPLDILSENMTVSRWQALLDAFRGCDLTCYDGVIVLHGTDTLAYTSALLSIMLAGISIPVMMVSSGLPIYDKNSNGNDNFRTAVELIVNGIAPNVYAVYKNNDGMYLHYGSHLLQCAPHSDEFYSADMIRLDGNACPKTTSVSRDMLVYDCPALTDNVLKLEPYVGINYDRFCLDGVRAVLHTTYHSGTLAVDTGDRGASVMSLKARCDSCGAGLYIYPCDKNKAYLYETTGALVRDGVGTTFRMTAEMTYAKLLVGCALGLCKSQLQDFIDTEINGEFVY